MKAWLLLLISWHSCIVEAQEGPFAEVVSIGVGTTRSLHVEAWRVPQQSSSHLGGVVIDMFENCHVAQFLMGGDHALLQNVTVHIGIHVSFNELQLSGACRTHAAPDHDANATMLDCRQDTSILVLLNGMLPHILDTIWAKWVCLFSSDHRTWLH